MTDPNKELESLRAEVAELRADLESLPHFQTRRAEQRQRDKRARLVAIGKMDPADGLAALSPLRLGDAVTAVELMGPEAAAKILALADRAMLDRVLDAASRGVRDQVRAILTPDDQVPRHVWIEPRSSAGGYGAALEIPKKVASQLVDLGVGIIDPHTRSYIAPVLAIGLKMRWPVEVFELLMKHWPTLAKGVESGAIYVRPYTIAEDRALLASK